MNVSEGSTASATSKSSVGRYCVPVPSSVRDPLPFGVDPDPQIRIRFYFGADPDSYYFEEKNNNILYYFVLLSFPVKMFSLSRK